MFQQKKSMKNLSFFGAWVLVVGDEEEKKKKKILPAWKNPSHPMLEFESILRKSYRARAEFGTYTLKLQCVHWSPQQFCGLISFFLSFSSIWLRLTFFSFNNFYSEMDLVLNRKALTHFSCFLSCGLSGMNFYKIILSLMILLMPLNFFSKYESTLFVIMFFHEYHVYLLHHNYCLWINKSKMFNPLWFDRWFID